MMGLGIVIVFATMGLVFYLSIGTPKTASEIKMIYIKGPQPDIARVSLQDAKRAYDDDEALFLDVRNEDAFSTSHIPAAIFIPEYEIETRMNELSHTKWIITYCS